jgi:uncharacterized protein DUF5655
MAPGEPHDCWTTTEQALTENLSEELRDAYDRLRETAVAFGDQRIYASGTAIMFSRRSCYFFVRPRRSSLQLSIFLGRTVRAPQIRRVERRSAAKLAHIVDITHRDQVEPPITGWLHEAYELEDTRAASPVRRRPKRQRRTTPAAQRRRRKR